MDRQQRDFVTEKTIKYFIRRALLVRLLRVLMNATYETKDQQLKPRLATLEYKARRCKQCIERRLAVRN